ncbi:MAG: type II secretion system F family protein [Candidatus Aenigmarchaeota archaeon]|nr:type II secretion system F family protein [Candidatus Aenigmarchaeota archaeon]
MESVLAKYRFELISVITGSAIIAVNILYLGQFFPLLSPVINLAGGLIAVVPSTWVFYSRFRLNKEIEEQFIILIRDLTESINSGMTLPMALSYISTKDYRVMTPYVKRMAAQVDWGIPFKIALQKFADGIQVSSVKRAISTILETYRVGGKVGDTLSEVSKSLIVIDRIRKERSSSVHSQVVTSYLIFFIFIFILVVLHAFLIPSVTNKSSGLSISSSITGLGSSIPPEELSQIFTYFLILQGFFAGLATGKMAEGSIVAGLKHSIMLIAIGYSIFAIAIQLPLPLVSPELSLPS